LNHRRIDHRSEPAGCIGIGQVVDIRDLDAIHHEQVLHRMAAAHQHLVTEVAAGHYAGQKLQVPRNIAISAGGIDYVFAAGGHRAGELVSRGTSVACTSTVVVTGMTASKRDAGRSGWGDTGCGN